MKCLILAGGRGERLWPLSRKDFPKQFIQIQKNHSVFQETVLRNMPYCDEFIIVTNYEYRHIVAYQLESFQGISYRCIFEEEPLKTTAAILLACMDLQPSEYVFVVASDHLVDTKYESKNGELSYRDAILKAKNYAKEGSIVLFGMPEKEINTRFGYITGLDSNGNIRGFSEKPSNTIMNRLMALGGIYRNLGLCLFQNAVFQNELQIYAENIYNQCEAAYGKKRLHKSNVVYSKELRQFIEPIAIEKSLFEKSKNIKAVKTGFSWSDIGQLEDLSKTELQTEGVCIKNNCSNTVIINNDAEKAIVVNDLDDIIVVNTEDAVYIGKYGTSGALKDILRKYPVLQTYGDEWEESFLEEKEISVSAEDMIKISPVFRDYLWGGTRLRDVYRMNCDYDTIAESWQLSAHDMGQSIVASGKYKGMRFGDYLELMGKDALGWKCGQFQKFPLMIKFIDARENLSVQVHPDDDYAMTHEHEYGKNEMWYVVDAEEGAGLYIGFDRDVTPEEVTAHIGDDTITEILNFYPTKPGDVFFIPAGTVHAIGAGNFICEVQQSSNAIYRLYDYNRLDKFGNKRQLHLEKALEILNYKKYIPANYEIDEEGAGKVLSRCKYFEAMIYEVVNQVHIPFENDRFHAVVCIKGKGLLKFKDSIMSVEAGESIFIPAAEGILEIEGDLTVIVSYI